MIFLLWYYPVWIHRDRCPAKTWSDSVFIIVGNLVIFVLLKKTGDKMVCEHLRELEKALIAAGIKETYRGQAWSKVREWVYFDCVIDLDACRRRFSLPDFVTDHIHRGTHDGTEQGLYCECCRDGVMGRHPVAFPSDIHFP